MIQLNRLFNIVYGNGLGLNSLTPDPNGINFISRSALNNGVASRVKIIPDVECFAAGTITVALSGSVLESFVQEEPFYTSFHIFCLTPLTSMSFNEKLFYCLCIRANKYRYNYGRQANRTLKDILVPSRDEVPNWVFQDTSFAEIFHDSQNFALSPFLDQGQPTRDHRYSNDLIPLSDLFDVIYGTNLELNHLVYDPNGINFVSRTSKNNGISAKVKRLVDVEPTPEGMITVAAGGSVLEAFVQIEPFYSGRDLYYLKPRVDLTLQEKVFYCLCIRSNKYKYNYGRQANRTLKDILVPSLSNIPDWVNQVDITGELQIPLENSFKPI